MRNETNLKQEIYFFNEDLFEDLLELHNETLPLFQKIGNDYTTLGIGSITADIMRQISKKDFSEISKKVYDDINTNIKKTGITNQLLIEKLRKDLDEPFIMFMPRTRLTLNEIEQIKRNYTGIEFDINSYSIKNGAISFTPEDKARIKEKCTIYIDSQVKAQFLQLTETTLEKLNTLKSILNRNGINTLFGSDNLLSESDTGEVILNKGLMKYITK